MPEPCVGQIWEDTYVSNDDARWVFRINKLNEKSARVEAREDDGTFSEASGFPWQYRIDLHHFHNGRCRLIRDENR